MVAIYNYTPQKDSPNPNPGMELSFKTGDVITVYGQMVLIDSCAHLTMRRYETQKRSKSSLLFERLVIVSS